MLFFHFCLMPLESGLVEASANVQDVPASEHRCDFGKSTAHVQ